MPTESKTAIPTDLQAARAKCTLNVKAIGDVLLPPAQRRDRNSVADALEKEELWDLSVRYVRFLLTARSYPSRADMSQVPP